MAQRNKNWMRTLGADDVCLHFVLAGAGSAAMTVSDDTAKVLNPTTPVTYNSASGDYTLNFKDPWKQLKAFDCVLLQATPTANNSVALKTITTTTSTGGTIRFILYQNGAATDLASGDKAYFMVIMRDGVI